MTLGYQGNAQAALAAETDGEAIDYELRIVDEQEQAVAAGIEGEVQVRGPSMLLGYALSGYKKERLQKMVFSEPAISVLSMIKVRCVFQDAKFDYPRR